MIFGVLGASDLSEVRRMGAALPQYECQPIIHTPRPDVFIGEFTTDASAGKQSDAFVLDGSVYHFMEEPVERGGSRQVLQQVVSSGDLEQLNAVRGKFALAHWSDAAKELLLAVDHMGFKSLFYCQLDGRMAFSTEYKAFFALPDFEPKLDRESLQYYQALRTAMPMRPLLANIKKVPSGAVLRFRSGQSSTHRYWQPTMRRRHRSIQTPAEQVERQVTQSITQQIHGHERVGIALSGGLDSAIIAAVVARCKPVDCVTAYSVGYGDDDPDVIGARQVAQYLGFDHHVTTFGTEDIRRYLPTAVWMMEDCTGREESLLHLKMFEAMMGQVTVLMHGVGADFLFGGMPRHKLLAMAARLPPFRQAFLEVYQSTQSGLPANSALGKLLVRLVYKGNQFPPPRVTGIEEPTRVQEPGSFRDYLAGGIGNTAAFQYLEPFAQHAHVNFHSPFLDPDCVDLALKIPDHYKIGLRRQKIVLRQAFKDILPAEVMHRPKSLQRLHHDRDMSDTLDKMAADMGNFASIRKHNLVDAGYISRLQDRRNGEAYFTDRLYRLWTLVSTEIWLRQFLDGRGRQWSFDS
jgi:asparagine synthase (glutamine-hydrolysing)